MWMLELYKVAFGVLTVLVAPDVQDRDGNEIPADPRDAPAREDQEVDEVALVEDAAERANNPYTTRDACGAGYYLLERQAISGAIVYLLFNESNNYNCVVTLKTAAIGRPTYTSAELEVEDGGRAVDAAYYRYYASVKLPALHKCVRWGGTHRSDEFFSEEWEYCD